MSLSMYDASAPVFARLLGNLAAILDKAADDAQTRKFEPDVLANARLAPDMFPLVRQVQIMTDMAKNAAARLSGIDITAFPDTETTLAEVRARVQKTIDYLNGFTPAQINDSQEKTIIIKAGGQEMSFSGKDYLLNFVIPNFYFHMSMTYAILRHNGLALGKQDFLGNLAA